MFLPGESPWTEEPGGQQSMGFQRTIHDWLTKHSFTPIYTDQVTFAEGPSISLLGMPWSTSKQHSSVWGWLLWSCSDSVVCVVAMPISPVPIKYPQLVPLMPVLIGLLGVGGLVPVIYLPVSWWRLHPLDPRRVSKQVWKSTLSF